MSVSAENKLAILGFPPGIVAGIDAMRREKTGLFLVSGLSGSGRKATLQAILDLVLSDGGERFHAVVVAHPGEFDVPVSLLAPMRDNQETVDPLHGAMRFALYQDPELIILSRANSDETAKSAVNAALVGYGIWAGISASSAFDALDRLSGFGVPPHHFEDSVIRGIVHQQMLGVLCGNCRITFLKAMESGTLERGLGERAMRLLRKDEAGLFVRGGGCAECQSGFAGRAVTAEIVRTDAVLLARRRAGDLAGMREHWLKPASMGGLGGVPILHHALAKVGAGLCDINEIEMAIAPLSEYERDLMPLHQQLLKDVAILEARACEKRTA
ncbi:ATPase, T2SS/T4P/T4SS family [Defluviimonas salinarum]|uniref:ATPase, T2SS/T4P/T4SS family n=1 Tax=Defluviimonas salinarum TaxID=2992147 RepID=A0ABT3J594_9RHOB|nr:ATPase, T2SS/T4P/T4SS family [Defluviimonas salinarum]MCW3782574.1 ATPase, T2SS/T4P/T4SS family [Defluviimonas salinarum]